MEMRLANLSVLEMTRKDLVSKKDHVHHAVKILTTSISSIIILPIDYLSTSCDISEPLGGAPGTAPVANGLSARSHSIYG